MKCSDVDYSRTLVSDYDYMTLREKCPNTDLFLVCIFLYLFGLNTEIYSVNLHIQSKYRKIQTRKDSAFGLFSRSVMSPENIFASYQPGESFLVKDDTFDINPGYVKLAYGSSKYSSTLTFYTTRDIKDKLKITISNIRFREFSGYTSDDPNQNYASVVSKGPTLKLKVDRS